MHNRDILASHIIHHNLADFRIHAPIPQQQDISALKRGLHAAGQDDDDGGGGVGDDGEAFPEHEGGGEDEGEVEDLGEELARLEGGEGREHVGGGIEGLQRV